MTENKAECWAPCSLSEATGPDATFRLDGCSLSTQEDKHRASAHGRAYSVGALKILLVLATDGPGRNGTISTSAASLPTQPWASTHTYHRPQLESHFPCNLGKLEQRQTRWSQILQSSP